MGGACDMTVKDHRQGFPRGLGTGMVISRTKVSGVCALFGYMCGPRPWMSRLQRVQWG